MDNTMDNKTRAKRAYRKLTRLLDTFPFVSDFDKGVWVAAALTLALRPAIQGMVPLFVIHADRHGLGRTILRDMLGELVMGRDYQQSSQFVYAYNDNKKFTRQLLARPAMVLVQGSAFHRLEYAKTLEHAVELGAILHRDLGTAAMETTICRTVFIAETAMEPWKLPQDLHRRTVAMMLSERSKPKRERVPMQPHEVQARNPIGTIRAHRGALLSALFELARCWDNDESRARSERPRTTMTEWSELVCGAIQFAGGPKLGFTSGRWSGYEQRGSRWAAVSSGA